MKKQDNFLEYIPKIKEGISWKPEQDHVIIDMENKGLANRIAQICFGRPKVSHITLEELGSFIWQQIDGEKSILQIGELVQEAFGEKAEPLYERLAQYMKILYGKGFITFCKVQCAYAKMKKGN